MMHQRGIMVQTTRNELICFVYEYMVIYRQSDRRSSAKFVQLLWIENVALLAQRILTAVFSVLWAGAATTFSK
jgi:hypothetical protein